MDEAHIIVNFVKNKDMSKKEIPKLEKNRSMLKIGLFLCDKKETWSFDEKLPS